MCSEALLNSFLVNATPPEAEALRAMLGLATEEGEPDECASPEPTQPDT